MATEARIFVVDAFTIQQLPFTGNPSAVYTTDVEMREDTMQKIAAQMKLAETAFIRPISTDKTFESALEFEIRWFTPKCEMPLCAHATLATAHVLFSIMGNKNSELILHTLKSGVLKVRLEEGSPDLPRISMDFPAIVPHAIHNFEKCSWFHKLMKGFSPDLPVVEVLLATGVRYLLVHLSSNFSREELESVTFNADALREAHDGSEFVAVILTCRDKNLNARHDFYSRFLAPWVGIDEDSVTGSAHSVLAHFWLTRGCVPKVKLGGQQYFRARQCSPRGGDLLVACEGDTRVRIVGSCRLVLDGKFFGSIYM